MYEVGIPLQYVIETCWTQYYAKAHCMLKTFVTLTDNSVTAFQNVKLALSGEF